MNELHGAPMESILQDLDLKMNLFSHLIIMGIDTSKEEMTYEKIFNNTIDANFIDVYPKLETSNKLPSYLENYKLWCFPEGFRIYNNDMLLINQDNTEMHEADDKAYSYSHNNHNEMEIIQNKDQLYHFVMTDEHRIKRYCSALLFYEKIYVKKYDEKKLKNTNGYTVTNKVSTNDYYDIIYIPKSISIISILPVFEAQYQVLNFIYDNIIKAKRNNNNNNNNNTHHNMNGNNTMAMVKIPVKLLNQLDALYQKNQGDQHVIDRLWSNYYKNFVINSLVGGNNYTSNDIMVKDVELSESQLFEFYISVFFSLTPIQTISKETLILNEKNNIQEELIRYRINKNVGINLPGYNYKILFEKLSIPNIIQLIKFIVLERKILIFSRHSGDIPDIAETLMTLISPMTWMCIFIPYLPISMVDVIESFMPYLIGMSRKYMKFILSNYDLKEVVIVDLDEDKIIADDHILLPKKAKDYIIDALDTLIRQVKLKPKNNQKEAWIDFTLKSRQAFNIFFLQILNNYLNYFNFAKKEEGLHSPGLDVFKVNDYLKIFDKEEALFMKAFCTETMMFSRFLEDSYELLYHCDITNVEIWDEQHDEISQFITMLKYLIKLNNTMIQKDFLNLSGLKKEQKDYLNVISIYTKNLKIFEIIQNQQIHDCMSMYDKPEKIYIMEYLIKYYYYFNFLKPSQSHCHHCTVNGINQCKGTQCHNHHIKQIISNGLNNHQHHHHHHHHHYHSIHDLNERFRLLPCIQFDKILDLNQIFRAEKLQECLPSVDIKANTSLITFGNIQNYNTMILAQSQILDNQSDIVMLANASYPTPAINVIDKSISIGASDIDGIGANGDDVNGGNNGGDTTQLLQIPLPCSKYVSENSGSMMSIPHEESPMNKSARLRKKNYYLYYQFVKRNNAGEPSPTCKYTKKIFENRNKYLNEQNEIVSMITASFAWDSIASKSDEKLKDELNNDKESHFNSKPVNNFKPENKLAHAKNGYVRLDYDENRERRSEIGSANVENWRIKTEKDDYYEENEPNKQSNIYNDFHGENPKYFLEGKMLDSTSNNSTHITKRRMRKEMPKIQNNSVNYDKAHVAEILDSNTLHKKYNDSMYGAVSKGDKSDSVDGAERTTSIFNTYGKDNDGGYRCGSDSATHKARKVIFEMVREPKKSIRTEISPLNLYEDIIASDEEKTISGSNKGNFQNRGVKSCTNAKRKVLDLSKFRGDQDQSPERPSPFECQHMKPPIKKKDDHFGFGKLLPVDDQLQAQKTPHKTKDFKGMITLNNESNNHGYNQPEKSNFSKVIAFVKNLDTGELVDMNEVNKQAMANKRSLQFKQISSFSRLMSTKKNYIKNGQISFD